MERKYDRRLANRQAGRRHYWKHYPAERVATFARTSAANAASLSDSRLISTFAKAPSIAARANATAVVRSDFIFGLVMGLSRSAIPATSLARSATFNGTLVA